MSGPKVALKAISAAIKAQKYDDAVEGAQRLLATDPQNYQASLILGFALSKMSQDVEAENAYDAAVKIKDSDPQVWQGLIQLYEKQGGEKIRRYHVAALRLAEIYQSQDEKYKCQDVIDKFLSFAKGQGTRIQYKTAQEIILPGSPVYDYLEGRIPHPSNTYQVMAQITEFDEKERINKEIGERRTRLGAKIGQVTVEVKREVLKESDLEDLYSRIIDWSNDDDVRRHYEEKLIQRCVEIMIILPPGKEKIEKQAKTFKLASDMVIIRHPYKLAWEIAIEWRDPENIEALDRNVLSDFVAFFPTSGLGQVLRGFLDSVISPFPPPPPLTVQAQTAVDSDESDDYDEGGGASLIGPLSSEDRLLIMMDGISDAPKSILAHRLMGEYYQYLEEHESVVELMRNGRRLVIEESNKTGLNFENSSESMAACLGTALVFYQSPRNHLEAKTLFDDILKINPNLTAALIGIGLIYEEEEDYPAAVDFLERALRRDPKNIRVKAEAAWVKALAGNYVDGKQELEGCLNLIDMKDQKRKDLVAQTQYRIGLCLWNVDTSKAARKDRNGAYAYFLAALKSNLNFAPAYTSLGVFYADCLNDKKRSRKCFQKALELSPSEIEAAERLARIFAEQRDWELVEAIAQRVVESGKAKPAPGSKKKGISWPFVALGLAQLNKQDYSKSIVSFQSALRLAPSNYHAWVGLGESYHSSGRYIAATKALQHAEKFEQEVEQHGSGETWFVKHMLANVKHELGDYNDAIERYKAVLGSRPFEFGVAIALIQALVESAWDGIEKGLFGYASQRATEAINTALKVSEIRPDAFNLWKSVGDACSVFSWIQSYIKDFPHLAMKQLLQIGDEKTPYELYSDIDGVGIDVVFAHGLYSSDEEDGLNLTRCLHAAILAHKRAIHTSAHDAHAQAVAYYNLGWVQHRAHVCLINGLKKRSTRYLKTSVRCFKRAIELEAGNAEFWNALGVVTSELNPKVAQHAFVRSLFLNERSVQAWTNLGTLYMLQNDFALANEAFTRAQSSDPDFSHAWIGQGLLALLMTGDTKEAKLLFTHATEIADSSSLITKRQYAQSVFDQILASTTEPSITDLVQPLFALNQLHSMAPGDHMYQHLSTLFLERIGNATESVSTLSKICATLEADFEVTESPSTLSKFALAKADLARVQLSVGSYDEAVESGDTALQLSGDDAATELTSESRQKCQLSAHLTVGLAQYYLGQPDEALQYFIPALEESDGDPDAVCLLAQVFWAKGDEESRSKSSEYLFDCVEKHPEHVQSVILLGIIALFDNDLETLEVVTATLQDLRANHTITDLEQSRVGELLRAIAVCSDVGEGQAALAEVQTDVFLHPSQPYGWTRLSNMAGDEYTAEMAMKTALKSVPPRGDLDANDLAEVFTGLGSIADGQVAAFIAPWRSDGWDCLREASSQA